MICNQLVETGNVMLNISSLVAKLLCLNFLRTSIYDIFTSYIQYGFVNCVCCQFFLKGSANSGVAIGYVDDCLSVLRSYRDDNKCRYELVEQATNRFGFEIPMPFMTQKQQILDHQYSLSKRVLFQSLCWNHNHHHRYNNLSVGNSPVTKILEGGW